ncbi:MAG: HAD-IIIC family phosphatase [Solirubrobacteraceae bacterium]|nr:HAD-IIIC family phosphatase [Solirubrobacteraceae bacterium]
MTVVPSEPLDLAVLNDRSASLADVKRALRAGETVLADAPELRFGLSATATLDLLATMLRRRALTHGLRATVHQGSLDAHLDNIELFAAEGVEHLVLVTTLDALVPAFEARAATFDDDLLQACSERLQAELRLALDAAAGRFKTIDVALPHRLSPRTDTPSSRAIDDAVALLRDVTAAIIDDAPGARALDLDAALASVGFQAAVDPRFALRFGAPYSAAASDEIARRLLLTTRASAGRVTKAIVLDADGTLWGGILGEDGLEGIALDPTHYPGNAFWTVQQILRALQRQGVLLCLASKNNPEDVAEALEDHPAMVLRAGDFVISKVSWDDKVDSIVAIAEELNIGLDSLVFVDDSDFELAAVSERLPEVTTVRVPNDPWAWPGEANRLAELVTTGRRGESADKTEQYRARAAARVDASRHATRDDYLRSLELRVDLSVDDRASLARIAELTQKSNQFNLTTRRYGESEIAAAMDDDAFGVFALTVSDRFGDHGLTGVLIAHCPGDGAVEVDAFLMSCRVLGRGIEQSCWEALARWAADRGCTEIRATFRPTQKNAQVADFYDRLGLSPQTQSTEATTYSAPLAAVPSPPDHLKVHVH